MTANTGRTVSRWTKFLVDNSAGTLTEIAVDSINGVGLNYPEVDLTAFMDAIRGALPNTPECAIDITGPLDTTATTGNHIVLTGINGLSTPLALDIRIGIRHTWEAGEPVFGLTATAANGFLCTSYNVDPSGVKYSAHFVVFPGSAAPDWATTAHT